MCYKLIRFNFIFFTPFEPHVDIRRHRFAGTTFYGDELGMLLIHIIYLHMCGWIRDACVLGNVSVYV